MPNSPIFEVLSEAPEWIGIVKPSGQSIDAVKDFLKKAYPRQKFACVYQLETAIAGPVLFAKTLEARNTLKNAYGSYQFSFIFDGWGVSEKTLSEPWDCDLSIAWDERKNRAFPSKKHGKKSLTHFEILSATHPFYRFSAQTTYLRTQQLQIHAHFSHLDILGDPLAPTTLPVTNLQLILRSVSFLSSTLQELSIPLPTSWDTLPQTL